MQRQQVIQVASNLAPSTQETLSPPLGLWGRQGKGTQEGAFACTPRSRCFTGVL